MKFGLIGENISYSISPALHSELMAKSGDALSTYEIFDTDNLGIAISHLRTNADGFNVTKPYKIDVIKYLDEVDSIARRIGSVNTVVNRGGKLIGYNTDIDGIIATFALDNVDVRGKNCLMIGYGGVARTVAYALHIMGANSISVTGRNLSKMETFVDSISEFEVKVDKDAIGSYDIVINATSVGQGNSNESPIDVCKISHIDYYFDLIYSPRTTYLMRLLREKGVKCRDGLYMLVVQAAKAQEYYRNTTIENDIIMSVYLQLAGEIFKNRLKSLNVSRIVLVGFMGAGKTTVGLKLKDIINYDFVDTDAIIETEYGSIENMFKEHGEKYFRDIETNTLKDINKKDIILSTGGGVVQRDDNICILKSSSNYNVFLHVPFDIIASRVVGSNRPLFRDTHKAMTLYNSRYSKYLNVANVVIDGDADVYKIIDDIMRFI